MQALETRCDLVIVGASARAAAFSALRAGLRPWCADLFADADLQAVCPVVRVPAKGYPQNLIPVLEQAPPGPVVYTGALENWPEVLDAIAERRPLWGNPSSVCRRVRDPIAVTRLLQAKGLECPRVLTEGETPPEDARWLLKPKSGAGGVGIRFWTGERRPDERHYVQEFIAGEPISAVFVADGFNSRLLGVTRQLIGEPWLNARPFRYCGSVTLNRRRSASIAAKVLWMGLVLTQATGLRGLFGIDCVVRDGTPYLIEVNPRYTASVEVLEYAFGLKALLMQREAFAENVGSLATLVTAHPFHGHVGKAILYAHDQFVFPADGPWKKRSREPQAASEMPTLADMPKPGTVIEAGKPILSAFVMGRTPASCLEQLQETANHLPFGAKEYQSDTDLLL